MFFRIPNKRRAAARWLTWADLACIVIVGVATCLLLITLVSLCGLIPRWRGGGLFVSAVENRATAAALLSAIVSTAVGVAYIQLGLKLPHSIVGC